MAQSSEKKPKSGDLPNPELNPLVNPTLGQNLGKWAQVYFTTPPEKRTEAVTDLLRELETGETETEAGKRKISMSEFEPPNERIASERICPACEAGNRPDQKFCGLCGAALEPGVPPSMVRPSPPVEMLPSLQPAARDTEPEPDVEWLREKTLYIYDDNDSSGRSWAKYIAIGVILAGGFIGLRWWSRASEAKPAPVAAQTTPEPQVIPTAPTTTAQPPVEHPAPSTVTTESETVEMKEKHPVIERAAETPAPQVRSKSVEPAVNREAAEVEPPAGTSGAEELRAAEGYLSSQHGQPDYQEASKWLWKAVRKENTQAVVMLADLYAHGNGVPRSCDQARLLLVAAAKKGSSEAAQKIRNLPASGCQ